MERKKMWSTVLIQKRREKFRALALVKSLARRTSQTEERIHRVKGMQSEREIAKDDWSAGGADLRLREGREWGSMQ